MEGKEQVIPFEGAEDFPDAHGKFGVTLSWLHAARQEVEPLSDEEIIRKGGYPDENAFWAVFVCRPTYASEFVSSIVRFVRPIHRPSQEYSNADRFLTELLRMAISSGQAWIRRGLLRAQELRDLRDLSRWLLDVPAAAEWLAAQPDARDLIPRGLLRFLGIGQDEAATSRITLVAAKIEEPGGAQLLFAIKALQSIYPSGPPPGVYRARIQEKIKKETGHSVSSSTLDRARQCLGWTRQPSSNAGPRQSSS
jgi:hypothetical protein